MNDLVKKYFQNEKYGNRNLDTIKMNLSILGINHSTDFAKFYLSGKAGPYFTKKATKDLEDLNEAVEVTKYIRDEFEMPDKYIGIGSIEGDALLLYDRDCQSVFYISWNEIDSLLKNEIEPTWKTFNDYLNYYFEDSEE